MPRNRWELDTYIKLAGLIVPIFIAVCIAPFQEDIRSFVKDLIATPTETSTPSTSSNRPTPTNPSTSKPTSMSPSPGTNYSESLTLDHQCETASMLVNIPPLQSNDNLQKYLRYQKLKRDIESLEEDSTSLCEAIKEMNNEQIKQECDSEWNDYEKCFIRGRLLTKLEFQYEIVEKNQKLAKIETEIKNKIEELEKL